MSYFEEEKILDQSIEDMSFFHEIKKDALLNLEWSDGDMFLGKGKRYQCFPDEIKKHLRFWKNDIYLGHEAITYKGRVVYQNGQGIKINQGITIGIMHSIECGYEYNNDVFKD